MNNKMRNKFCWCGSGKKFKNCHANLKQIPSLHLLRKILKIGLDHKYCLAKDHTNCCGEIIMAHTVSKRNQLASIAKDGHVYFLGDNSNFIKESKGIDVQRIGVKKASTFTGFCSYHDNRLFQKIDKEEFTVDSEYIFLLSYRALCNEIYKKRRSLYEVEELKKVIPFYTKNVKQRVKFDTLIDRTSANLEIDELYVKDIFEKTLHQRSFDKIQYAVLFLDRQPQLLCNSILTPFVDADFKQLQDESSKDPLKQIAFSLISTSSSGAVVFSWIEEEGLPESIQTRFMNSFLQQEKLVDELTKLIFLEFEDVFMSPDYWEQIDQSKQEWIKKYFSSFFEIDGKLGQACYPSAPTVPLVDWRIQKIEKNF